MILKEKDCKDEEIRELNRLLNLNISSKQRFLIEREYSGPGFLGHRNGVNFVFKETVDEKG